MYSRMRSLGFFKSVMIAFQDARGVLHIQVVLGDVRPGQVEDPIQVGADDAHLGRHGRHLVQALEFLHGNLARLIRQHRLEDAFL